MVTRQKAPVFKMQPNVDRIIHAILYLISEAEKRGQRVTQYALVKALFLADRAHLNKYGRPVTFDNYVAMLHGPVPSLAYDFLKENKLKMAAAGVKELPWTKTVAPEINDKTFLYGGPKTGASEDILSPSDIEELGDALGTVNSLSFPQIRRLIHEDQAYVDAWEDDGGTDQYPMSYALLFDVPDEETAQALAFASKHV